jgi:putative transposase
VLYGFYVVAHDRRRIVHFNVTAHPTNDWIVQQLREALPFPSGYRFMLLDRDAKFGKDVFDFLKASSIEAMRTSPRSPWQNGIAERWVGSCRREMLDHVIPLNEQHLRRLVHEYLEYYHADRTHLGLEKKTPANRVIEFRSNEAGTPRALPRVGGLHHRYTWSEAA